MEKLTTFTNDGLTFDVTDEGPVDGTPIVLLHGFPQTASEWSLLTPHLHELGYRTIAPTQRGYSPSARPKGRHSYRMSALVGDTAALIETIGQPVHLVGHDWGAAVAWSTAALRPELVRTLTTVSVPHPMALVRSLLTSDQALRSYYMALFQLPWLPERLLASRFAQAQFGMNAEQRERVNLDIIESGALTYALNWYRALPLNDPRSASRRVSCPTTHVWSTRDKALGRKGAELAAEYVTGPYRLEVLDATHWIPEERPSELANIIAARAGDAAD